MSLEKMMAGLPTKSHAELFNNEKFFGLTISFSETGFGWGEVVFAVNKETGEATFDNEEMNMNHCATILERLEGTTVSLYKGRDYREETPA